MNDLENPRIIDRDQCFFLLNLIMASISEKIENEIRNQRQQKIPR